MEGIYMDEEHTDSVMYANANGPLDSLRMAYIDSLAKAKHYDSEMRLVENDLRFWNGYRDALDTTGTLDYYKTYLRSTYTYTSKKLLTELLLNQEEWEDAQDMMDTVWMLSAPEDSLETAWFTDYTELMSEVGQQEGGIMNMDSAQKAQMYSIAENGAHVAPKAQAILYLVDTTAFEYPIEKIEYGGGQKWSNTTETNAEQQIPESAENIGYKLYPNPNDGRMTLEYALEDEKGKFLLFDSRGKLLSDIELTKGSHTITIEQQDLSNGIYLFSIMNNKRTLHNGRIAIIK